MSYQPIRCYLCNIEHCNTLECKLNTATYKKINNRVSKSSSERLIRVGAQNVLDRACLDPCPPMSWNQSSDRVYASGTGVRMTMPLGRPGGGVSQPKNAGVDIKHNSYARRLRKLQGKVLSNE